MRILICGDRNWTDREKIAQQLRIIHVFAVWAYAGRGGLQNVKIIHGAARGADRIAGEEAAKLGFVVKAYPISGEDWAHFKGGAGPLRNQLMLDEGKPDLVLAFHSNIYESKGTKDMVNRAMMAQIPVEVIS